MIDRDPEHKARALAELARAYQQFSVEELDWDWGCNLGDESHAVLEQEYARRGIAPGSTGRGRRRGGPFV